MKLFDEKKNIAITAAISLFCATLGAVGGSRMAIVYYNNRLLSAWWAKTANLLYFSQTRHGLIWGACAGLIAGYLWCRYMSHRTAKYLELNNPSLITLVGEGVIMSITLGWMYCALLLLEIHLNSPKKLSARELSTLLPLCMSLSLLVSLLAGTFLSEIWWLRTSYQQKKASKKK